MTQPIQPTITPREFVKYLKKHYLLWIVPTVVMTAGSLVYALTRPQIWQATQALMVRDEAGGNLNSNGRFDSTAAMKTAQETILEISKSHTVARAALAKVGPTEQHDGQATWPSTNDVESLQGSLSVSAPNGSEFGQTEVIRLSVKAPTQGRAIKLTSAVCDQLDQRLRELRNLKAGSISAELTRAVKLASADLNIATEKLQALESEVGSDLGELRSLSNSAGGDSNLRSSLNQISAQLISAQTAHETNLQRQKHLLAAQQDPGLLIAIPNRALESQPALKRLKDGLVDAQLNTSRLMGRMSRNHPHVKAAIVAEQEMRANLRSELNLALRGLTGDLQVSLAHVASLERQEEKIKARLDRLAQLRARYANLVGQVAQRTEILKQSQKDLADARASQSAAQTASLISRLDGPVVGNHPIGPGKSTIVVCGFFGGLLTGLGLVFLQSPLGQIRGRRLSDFLPARRRSDQSNNGRRTAARDGGRRDRDPSRGIRSEDQNLHTSVKSIPQTDERQKANDRRQGDRRGSESPTNKPLVEKRS